MSRNPGMLIDEFRDELKKRLPDYGFFDGVAAALVIGFLNLIAPAPAPRKTRDFNRETRRLASHKQPSAISSCITRG